MAHDPESPELTAPALEDTVERFSSDLRLLRIAAGSPTLVHLRHQTRLSRTVISEAFAGKQLPSARTVAGIVAACDGDPAEWIRRRDALSVRAADRDAEAVEGGAVDADDAPRLPSKQTPPPSLFRSPGRARAGRRIGPRRQHHLVNGEHPDRRAREAAH